MMNRTNDEEDTRYDVWRRSVREGQWLDEFTTIIRPERIMNNCPQQQSPISKYMDELQKEISGLENIVMDLGNRLTSIRLSQEPTPTPCKGETQPPVSPFSQLLLELTHRVSDAKAKLALYLQELEI